MAKALEQNIEIKVGMRISPEELGKKGYARMPIKSFDGHIIMIRGIAEQGESRIEKVHVNEGGVIVRIF